ncbi:MAG: nucleoside-diphosphate kinase [Cytophagales bacterium]
MERTAAIIKPLAYQKGYSGKIITDIEAAGFSIPMMYRTQFSKEEVAYFYKMHKERPFFGELVDYMASGPVVVLVLEKENAIKDFRNLLGPTDAKQAPPETLRGQYGTSVEKNGIHGSDSAENATREISFFTRRQQGCGNRCQCRK